MPPCASCHTSRAQILRPRNSTRLCSSCFLVTFESEILTTIKTHSLFAPHEKIAIGASGGKDSTVLASVLSTLNTRHNLNLNLTLLSIDEGITGYRDHSLDAVRRNSEVLNLPLKVLSYEELYQGWSMDRVVSAMGRQRNCTYCGVFRRQALDRGAAMLGVRHVVTGHNADDLAETVVMNLLRGDVARLGRGGEVVTRTGRGSEVEVEGEKVHCTEVKRSKPLMYAYEKEIVMYAHHKGLEYFSTECTYSPEAFRGSARTLVKNLERIRPRAILDLVNSGREIAKLVPDRDRGGGEQEEEGTRGCGKVKAGQMDLGAVVDESKEMDVGRTKKQKLGRCERCGYLSSQRICKACDLLEGLNKTKAKVGIEIELETEVK